MKTVVSLSLLFMVSYSIIAGGEDFDRLSSGLIYSLNDKPTPQCHASTVVETRNGTPPLVAVWYGGKHERNPDVGIWVSRHHQGEWSKPIEVVNGEWTLGRRFACWNPVLFQPTRGALILFYKVGLNPREWWGEMMTSTDNGKTWGNRKVLPLGGIGPVKNKPIELDDGSILCPSSSEHQRWRVHFEITRDQGET